MNQKTNEDTFETLTSEMPGTPSVPASRDTGLDSDDESGMDWDDITRQLDESESEYDELEGEAPAEQPPAEAELEEQPAEEEPAASPEQQESPPETAEEAVDEKPPSEPEPAPEPVPQISEEKFQELRQQTMAKVAEQFQMTEEEADQFLTEPQKIIPQFAARLYVDIYESLMRGMHMTLPAMIGNVNNAVDSAQQAENDFYEAWPVLKDKKHRATVTRLGVAYRHANPDADVKTFIQEVGAQAIVALKLPVPGAETVELPTGATPTPDVQSQPHKPASTTGGGQPESPVKNPWEEMSIEFELEDQIE